MSRTQRACLVVGFFLLIGATLFPPWRYSSRLFGVTSSGSSFGFLLKPPIAGATLQLSRLVVEWALIAFLTGGLFFLAGKASTPQSVRTLERKTASQEIWRRLFSLSVGLYVLIVALGVVSYASIRKTRRLETGIQNVKGILESGSKEFTNLRPLPPVWVTGPIPIQPPPPEGAIPIPTAPVGRLTPVVWIEQIRTPEQLQQLVRAEYDRVVNSMQKVVESKDETLKRATEELDKLN